MNTKLRFASLIGAVAIVAAACGGGTATTAPTTAPASAEPTTAPASGEPTTAPASEAPTGEPLVGELTVWHSYGSGGGETGAFQQALGAILVANKDLKVNVVEQPFSDIFTKWNTDVAAGGGPDMFIAPNDSLYSQAEGGVLLDLTDALAGKLEGFSQTAVDGSQVDLGSGPRFFMVPESLKAVALWYDKTAIATPPATTDELLAGVTDGSIKLGLNQSAYHNFGWGGAFGGVLMDADGKCTADTTGFGDAFKFMADLKAAGAKFYPDGNAQKQDFQTGVLNMTVDGPWQTADFVKALGDKLAVAPMPGGPGGAANPLTGTDGWYINPNTANADLAVAFALQMVGTASEQTLTNNAGHVPAAPGVTINSPIVQGFADAAASGLPRPQRAEFNNFWGPFGDAINTVIDKGEDPATAATNACSLMNEANGK